MLGHKVFQTLLERFPDTFCTIRGAAKDPRFARIELLQHENVFDRIDTDDFDSLKSFVRGLRPEWIVNCVGVIKQRDAAKKAVPSLLTNALLPHRLADLAEERGCQLVHFSTDCVFSGSKGMYSESGIPDAEDFYGRSKLLGEVNCPHCLTLRTSVIGRELGTANGLVEWFLRNRGRRVEGFTNAIYTGFPTLILAQVLADVIEQHPDLSGLYHVSSEPISKYKLLRLLRDAYKITVDIDPFPDVRIDRSLDSSRFRAATGFLPLSWPEMIRAMAKDPTSYEKRKTNKSSERSYFARGMTRTRSSEESRPFSKEMENS